LLTQTRDISQGIRRRQKQLTISSTAPASAARKLIRQPVSDPKTKKPDRASKQSHVIAMLRSPKGATIAAMMKATGWRLEPYQIARLFIGPTLFIRFYLISEGCACPFRIFHPAQIRIVRQNHRIIEIDVCNPANFGNRLAAARTGLS
jgi:Protein of unknown function (DUF3489)